MNNEILEKFNKAKEEAITNPPKKKRGCTSCKKKKEEPVDLPEIDLTPIPLIIYDEEDIIKAYHEMVRKEGIREEYKIFINNVYNQLFNEDYMFDKCISCKNNQYHKMRNYILYELKRTI